MRIDKVSKRFEEFINTYPEEMRYKVNVGNCILLMEWAYKEGYRDASKNIGSFAESCELLYFQEELFKEFGLEDENGKDDKK